MIPLTLDEIAALCPGRLDAAPWADEITGVQIDSRRIDGGRPVRGRRRGRATSRATPFARGAAAALVPDDAFAALAALGARRSRAHAARAGRRHHRLDGQDVDEGHPRRALPLRSARTVAAEDGLNNEIGVPLTLCRLEPDTEICVLEMAHARPRPDRRAGAIARPDVGVITNVGPVHLELLGSRRAGRPRPRAELLAALPRGGAAVVPDERSWPS